MAASFVVAIGLLSLACAVTPRDVGDLYLAERDYESAVETYDEVIRANPIDDQAHNGRGLAYSYLGEPHKAVRDFNEAIRLFPSAVYYSNRGVAYMELDDYAKALGDFDKAIEISPYGTPAFDEDGVVSKGYAYNNRGLAYYQLAQYEEAMRDFDEAIRVDPYGHTPYFNRGNTYIEKGDYQRALQDFAESIRLNPTGADGFAGRALAYAFLGEKEEANQDLEQAAILGYERERLKASIEKATQGQ